MDGWLSEFGAPRNARVEAQTISELLEGLERRYPRLAGKIRDDSGAIRRYVRVFVNGETAEGPDLHRPLSPQDRVDILHSIAGG